VAALTLAGCTASEQPLLDQFFSASRLRDTTALQAVATVAFEPLQQGIVRTFQITGVTPERIEGGAVTKEATVEALVVMPDGQTLQKTLVVTMWRDENPRDPRDPSPRGSARPWMVTGVRDAPAATTR